MAQASNSVGPHKAKQPRKLRILCLHGYNNNSQIMMYQMQNFINTLGDLCEFSFIEGVHNAVEPPIQYFVEKGIVPPYKTWMRLKYQLFRSLPDGSQEIAVNSTTANMEYVMESNYHIIDFMNRQEEPFDGMAGFSQGMYQVSAFFKMQQYFGKKLRFKHPMPYFVIDFNGPRYNTLTYEFYNSSFISGENFLANCDTIHFLSDKDPMAKDLTVHLNCENPTIVKHNQGHRPVKSLPRKKLRVLYDFIARQYERKNGAAQTTEHVKAALDQFYGTLSTSSMLPWKTKPLQDKKDQVKPRPKL